MKEKELFIPAVTQKDLKTSWMKEVRPKKTHKKQSTYGVCSIYMKF